ncbi:MAG: glycoside hydrolase family 28 protein [Planctomycetota bacterium]|jgi:polygalacturonase
MIKDRAIMRNLKMGATYSRNLKRIIVEVSGVLTLIFLMCGVGNARTCCTAAIQKAIDVCAVRGGGCVYFPPGSYLTGTLILKSNVSLKLEAGATLLGSEDLSDYELPYLIYAKDARNISIRGAGSVNGQGEIFWRGKKRPYKRPSKMIQLEDCRDVRIEDITLTNSPNWTLNLVRCDWVEFTKLDVKPGKV